MCAYALVQAVASCAAAGWPEHLPRSGHLTCSYTAVRARRGVARMEARQVASLVRQLRSPSASDHERLAIVATCTMHALLTCAQVGWCTTSQGQEA